MHASDRRRVKKSYPYKFILFLPPDSTVIRVVTMACDISNEGARRVDLKLLYHCKIQSRVTIYL